MDAAGAFTREFIKFMTRDDLNDDGLFIIYIHKQIDTFSNLLRCVCFIYSFLIT